MTCCSNLEIGTIFPQVLHRNNSDSFSGILLLLIMWMTKTLTFLTSTQIMFIHDAFGTKIT